MSLELLLKDFLLSHFIALLQEQETVEATEQPVSAPRIWGTIAGDGSATGRQSNFRAAPGTGHLTQRANGLSRAVGDTKRHHPAPPELPRNSPVVVNSTPPQPAPERYLAELRLPLSDPFYPSLVARNTEPAGEELETGYGHYALPGMMSDLLRWERLNPEDVAVPYLDFWGRHYAYSGLYAYSGSYVYHLSVALWPYATGYRSFEEGAACELYTFSPYVAPFFEGPGYVYLGSEDNPYNISYLYPEWQGFRDVTDPADRQPVTGFALPEPEPLPLAYSATFANPRVYAGAFEVGQLASELALQPLLSLSGAVMSGTLAVTEETAYRPLRFYRYGVGNYEPILEPGDETRYEPLTHYGFETASQNESQTLELTFNQGEFFEPVMPKRLFTTRTRLYLSHDGESWVGDTPDDSLMQEGATFLINPDFHPGLPDKYLRVTNPEIIGGLGVDTYRWRYGLLNAQPGEYPEGYYEVLTCWTVPHQAVISERVATSVEHRQVVRSRTVRVFYEAQQEVAGQYLLMLENAAAGYEVRVAPVYSAGISESLYDEYQDYSYGGLNAETGEQEVYDPPRTFFTSTNSPEPTASGSRFAGAGASVTLTRVAESLNPRGVPLNDVSDSNPAAVPDSVLVGALGPLEPEDFAALNYSVRLPSVAKAYNGTGAYGVPPDMAQGVVDDAEARAFFSRYHPLLCEHPDATLHNPMAEVYESVFMGLEWSERWYNCNAFAVRELEGEQEVLNTYAVVLLDTAPGVRVRVGKNGVQVWEGDVWSYFPLAKETLTGLDDVRWPQDYPRPVRPDYEFVGALEAPERDSMRLWPFTVRRRGKHDRAGQAFGPEAADSPVTFFFSPNG